MSALTLYLIFPFVKSSFLLFIYLGLFIKGATWQQLLRNHDHKTVTRVYNQLLKLIKEHREQKKMIEEQYSSKESVVYKKKRTKKRKKKK